MYVIIHYFVENFIEKRKHLRRAHLEYIESYVSKGLVIAGGALLPNLEKGLILFNGTNDEVKAFIRCDPYVENSIIRSSEVAEWNIVAGKIRQCREVRP